MKTPLVLLRLALTLAGALAIQPFISARAIEEIVRGTDEFEFVYRVKLPALDGAGKVWLPLAKTDAFQTVKVDEVSTLQNSRTIHDRDYGNDVLVLPVESGDGGKTIEIMYHVSRSEKAPYVSQETDSSRYLKPERLVPENETFKAFATEITRGKQTDLERGRALYDHVAGRMKYDKSGTGWGRGDAIYACDARTGNCTDFHAYFIALARAAGIPARFAIGFTIPADKDEGVIAGYHCWAEFLADGKWIPVDISEAAKNPALAEYYFGHHPANRFEFSVGRDLELNPAPASGPVNFLIYPLLEIDGKVVKSGTEFAFRRVKK